MSSDVSKKKLIGFRATEQAKEGLQELADQTTGGNLSELLELFVQYGQDHLDEILAWRLRPGRNFLAEVELLNSRIDSLDALGTRRLLECTQDVERSLAEIRVDVRSLTERFALLTTRIDALERRA